MSIAKFIKQICKSQSEHAQDLELIQNKLTKTLDDIIAKTDDYVTITTSLTTGTTSVFHNLGKKYTGFYVIHTVADVRIYIDSTSTADNTTIIPLKASASCQVTIRVF